MNPYAETRAALAALAETVLPADVAVFDIKPDRVVPAVAFVIPDDDVYLDRPSSGFGSEVAHLRLVLVPRPGENAAVVAAAEDWVPSLLDAIDTSETFGISPTGSVRAVSTVLNGSTYFGLSVGVLAEVHRPLPQ